MSNIDNNKNSTTTTTTTSTSTKMTGRQRRKKLKCFHLPVLLSAGGGRAGGAPPQHLRPGAAPSPSLLICYLIITLLASITAGPTTVLGKFHPFHYECPCPSLCVRVCVCFRFHRVCSRVSVSLESCVVSH